MAKFEKGQPRLEGAGRKAGVPNKTTAQMKDALALLVENNLDRLQIWLDEIYEKEGAGSAFKAFASLLEYHIPKLARTELKADNSLVDNNITVTLVKADCTCCLKPATEDAPAQIP